MERVIILAWIFSLAFSLAACGTERTAKMTDEIQIGATRSSPALAAPEPEREISSGGSETMKMNVQIKDAKFLASLEENPAARAFVELMKKAPVVLLMSDYSGFEKAGPLGTALPADNSQITTRSGDIVLYNGNQIVVFYGSNSWSYTRLGRIDDLTGWAEALGTGDVTVTFSMN